MHNRLATTTLYTKNQNKALRSFTEKLGFVIEVSLEEWL